MIFDLGGVVLEWRPRAAFADLLDDDGIDRFFDDIDFAAWNRQQDGGRDWTVAEAEIARDFPHYAYLAPVYRRNYHRVVDTEIPGTAELLADLAEAGVRLLALTNWSAELFEVSYQRFPVLGRFEGIVVSGVERMLKPDREIYQVLLSRYDVDPSRAAFVDDVAANVAAAQALGLRGVQFTDAAALRGALCGFGLVLPRSGPGPYVSG